MKPVLRYLPDLPTALLYAAALAPAAALVVINPAQAHETKAPPVQTVQPTTPS
ncbi:hypothetical protein MTR62_14225 [Novosphingobium sp. 1949]|uniref:Uncharacterized protein n=1 Tax=Novosphingobium organovorum TaxID=2930092 RepID=A0ABT0BGA5_9SPHN|nr:hypothetical protein [Novosphingobium organovorum]MCJ2183841.1 hypothetical protein [Novosphingobium organovorum]